MFYYYNALQTKSGDILPDYLVRLLDASGNEVDIYADDSSTPIISVSGVANAAKADDLGMVRFWVPNGTYDIAIYDTTDTFKGREEGVPMYDAGALTTDLSDDTGATLVGSTGGITVQASLDARPTTAALASSTGGGMVGDGDTTLAVSTPDTLAKYGALTDGSDATAGIDAALADSRQVEGLTGNYQAQGVTLGETGQVLASRGATNFMRNANGAIIDTAASDITINGIAFYGNDPTYSGDLLNFTGQRGKLLFSAARDTGTDKALKIIGSSWLILGANDKYEGDVIFTTDGIGGVSQYHNIIASRITGKLDLVDTSFVSVSGCLLAGNVTVDKGIGTAGGHGARLLSTRIVGTTTITQSSTCIGSGMSQSGNVTIGDGTNNYDGISVDPSFVQVSGNSFTILAGVKGTFHVGNLVATGVTVSIPASVRQTSLVYHGEVDYTPTISGGGGSFALGNGTLAGKYSQQGNIISGRTILSIGSTTTLPTSGLFTTVPVNTGGRPILCTIDIFVSGVGNYTAVGKIFSDGLRILGWLPQPAAIDSLFTDTVPAALGADDVVTWNFTYALGGV